MAVKRREFCKLATLSVLGLSGGSTAVGDATDGATIGDPITGKR